jgi:PhnB protein
MLKLNPYITFNGNTEAAFLFYKSVFGGDFTEFQRFQDVNQPGMEALSDADKSKIMHAALPIGSGNVLMGTDVLESMGHAPVSGNNIALSLNPESEAEAHRLFEALSVGGQVVMPLADMFWGALFGMVTDAFGIQWMVNCQKKVA